MPETSYIDRMFPEKAFYDFVYSKQSFFVTRHSRSKLRLCTRYLKRSFQGNSPFARPGKIKTNFASVFAAYNVYKDSFFGHKSVFLSVHNTTDGSCLLY